ncbi:MAG: transcription-repair coupling factor [Acidobacteria bacterium]|nr:transcription-repair coupling factor [Acidobacteriota bacterium]
MTVSPDEPAGRTAIGEETIARLRDRLESSSILDRILERERVEITGLPLEARGFFAATLQRRLGSRVVLLSGGDASGEALTSATRLFHPRPDRVAVYPTPSLSPYQNVSPSLSVLREELATLTRLAGDSIEILVLPARALLRRLPDLEWFRSRIIELSSSDEIEPHALLGRLIEEGYHRTDLVNEPGDLAWRGGIFDVFPPNLDHPVRIELFGDSIDSIRSFDPDTQRSSGDLEVVSVTPMTPFPDTEEGRRRVASRMSEDFNDASLHRSLSEKIDRLLSGSAYPGFEHDLALGWKTQGFGDYLGNGWITIVSEPSEIRSGLEKYEALLTSEWEHARERGLAVYPPEIMLIRPSAAYARLDDAGISFASVHVEGESSREEIRIDASPMQSFASRLTELGAAIEEWSSDGFLTGIVHGTRGGLENTERLLGELAAPVDSVELILTDSPLERGFMLRDASMAVVSEWDLYDKPPEGGRTQRKSRAFASDLRDLQAGDFVVHIDHGVARFGGLDRVPFGDGDREVMVLEYGSGGRLLVPMESLDLVQKYSAGGEVPPKLDKLGGTAWARTKASVRKAMRDMTEELLQLYARRSIAEGHAFSPDSPWQLEFESAFEFDETPDQSLAIEDIKRDMESRRPMDRLLCGDVGYGKTEVAMRAAFKAVMDGKQVAILAPTTVLAYQHYRTFLRRFASFPVFIELTSRLRSNKRQKEIAEKTASGEIDILIGTHRLLSRQIEFRDLGLLIVDEEQRFGVAQKERLKKLKSSIDVLAMSATPIPRTLNMSFSSLRDISLIETPPKDRLAIQTAVAAFDEDFIREAIQAEIERGGQVFFVHNRVDSIDAMKDYLERAVPGVRIAVGHGQMNERLLEDTMMSFIQGNYDVLLATTIIENGIDIPAANTMLINHAERFGLAQLYQLRGRVGRSDRLAYCYLLVPSQRVLSEDATRRLAAIQEFSALGAGFRIAARDLEIRGAGNLLGGEQSGHIASIGFEMYVRLLEETVAELKGEPLPEAFSTRIDLGLDIYIPEKYIDDENLRMTFYKRIASASDERTLEALSQEVTDRFGPEPRSVRSLFDYVRLRNLAKTAGVTSILRSGDGVAIRFVPEAKIDPQKLFDIVQQNEAASFSPAGIFRIQPKASGVELVGEIHEILRSILG